MKNKGRIDLLTTDNNPLPIVTPPAGTVSVTASSEGLHQLKSDGTSARILVEGDVPSGGVSSLNGLEGAVTLSASSYASINIDANTIVVGNDGVFEVNGLTKYITIDGTAGSVGQIFADVTPESEGGTISLRIEPTTALLAFETAATQEFSGASQTLVCTGLLASDTLLAVTLKSTGASQNNPFNGYQTYTTGQITLTWNAEPIPGITAIVAVKRSLI